MCTRGAVCSVRCGFLCSDSVVCCGGYRALATVLLQQSEPHVRCATVSPGIDIVVGRGTHSSLVNTLYQGLKRLESNQRLDSPLAPIVCTFLDNLNPPLKYTPLTPPVHPLLHPPAHSTRPTDRPTVWPPDRCSTDRPTDRPRQPDRPSDRTTDQPTNTTQTTRQ